VNSNHKLTEDPDIFVIERLKKGDADALRILFDKYFPILMRQAYRMTQNKEVSEELTHDIFVYIWASRLKLNINTSLKAYLLQAIRNQCYTYFRRKLRTNHIPLDDVSISVETSSNTNGNIHEEDLQQAINQGISSLPDKTRTVFLMSREEEMSYQEISLSLNISIKTVEYHMGNALKTLRIFIESHGYLILILITSYSGFFLLSR